MDHWENDVLWRDIEGFPNYEVSEEGDIRSKRSLRLLRPGWIKSDQLQVGLREGGISHQLYVSHIVAIAFIGPRPTPAHQLAHLDFNNRNNARDNLKWMDRWEMYQHHHQ